jgi:CheY-like chemotaxis protein
MADTRIVVVEDEAIVAMDIAATLRRFGYQVAAVVDSGAAAIDAVAAAGPDQSKRTSSCRSTSNYSPQRLHTAPDA